MRAYSDRTLLRRAGGVNPLERRVLSVTSAASPHFLSRLPIKTLTRTAWFHLLAITLTLLVPVAGAIAQQVSKTPRGSILGVTNDPRESLTLRGITDDDWRVATERPWSDEGWTALARMTYFVKAFSPVDLRRWRAEFGSDQAAAVDESTTDTADKESDAHADPPAGTFVRLTGLATKLKSRDVPAELAEFLDMTTLRLVWVTPTESARGDAVPYLLLTPTIPDPWLTHGDEVLPAGTPIVADAVFLGRVTPPSGGPDSDADDTFAETVSGSENREQTVRLAVSPRLAWFPTATMTGVTESLVTLAGGGYDVTTFDAVRGRVAASALTDRDDEALFPMTGALARLDAETFDASATPLGVETLLADPASWQGRAVRLTGRATRIIPVPIEDEILTDATGLTQCFQVDVIIPLGDTVLRMQVGDDPNNVVEFSRTFPITVCTPDLPENVHRLWRQRLAGGEAARLNIPVDVTGVFFRTAASETEAVTDVKPGNRQPVPVIVGRLRPAGTVESAVVQNFSAWFATLFAIAVLSGIWYVWRFNRQGTSKNTRGRQTDPIAHAERLREIKLKPAGPPDFSTIAKMDGGRSEGPPQS